MKISKSLLQAIAVAVTIGTTSACTKEKEPVDPETMELKKKKNDESYNCIACGRG